MSMETANLGVMSSDAFAAQTKATAAVVGRFKAKFKSRGSSMHGIDEALRQWERNCHRGLAPAQKLALLVEINLECNKWLARKLTKATALSAHRRQVVERLKKSLTAPMQYLTRKSKYSTGDDEYISPTIGLSGKFSYERMNYELKGKKQNPVSATLVTGYLEDTEGRGRSLGDIDYGEFTSVGKGKTVTFLNRAQRMPYMIIIENGLFFRTDESKAVSGDAGFGRVASDPFAVDKYGNMFSAELLGWKRAKMGQINHSSFTAGKEIILAGTIAWDSNGFLLYVSNLSGHYKPNRAQLQWYLAMLVEEGVDMTNVCIGAIKENGTEEVDHFRFDTFMDDAHAAPDWPNFDGPMPVVAGHKILNPM